MNPRDPLTDLSARIEEVQGRLQRRRQDTVTAWGEVQRQAGRALGPDAWRWPLGLGLAGGCVGGLLAGWALRRLGRSREPGSRHDGASAERHLAHGHDGRHWRDGPSVRPPSLLWTLLLQALLPVLESQLRSGLQGGLHRLIDRLLREWAGSRATTPAGREEGPAQNARS